MKTLKQIGLEIFAPTGKQSVTEWAEANIVVPSSVSAYSGRFKPINKYVTEPLNRAGELGTERLVLNWSTQASKTLCQTIMLLHSCSNNARPSMVCFPSVELGRRYSIDRLQKIIEASPNLHHLIPANSDDYTNLNMRLNPCTISIVGAGRPSLLSSASIGFLMVDEVDQLPDTHVNTNASLSLAIQRTKAYGHNATIVLASSPTCKSESGETIQDQYEQTDMRVYKIPCLKCEKLNSVNFSDETKFHVVFDSVKTDEGTDVKTATESARLKCPHCEETFNDAQKHQMCNHPNARWIATNKNALNGWYGYNAHTLLNSFVSMAEGVRLFLASKSSSNALQNFTNNYCAEVYTHAVEDVPTPIDLDNILSEYEQGAIVEGAKYFIGADVQQYYLPAVVIMQLPDMTQHLIDWQECAGFNDLQALAETYNAEQVIIDANYNTKVVYQECFARGWLPCKGWATMKVFYDFVMLDVEQGKASKFARKRIHQMNINKNHYSREFFKHRNGSTGAFFIYRNAPYELKRQLCSEVEISKKSKATGREVFSIKQIYSANHALDAVIYCQTFIDYYNGHNIKPDASKKRIPINERLIAGGDVIDF